MDKKRSMWSASDQIPQDQLGSRLTWKSMWRYLHTVWEGWITPQAFWGCSLSLLAAIIFQCNQSSPKYLWSSKKYYAARKPKTHPTTRNALFFNLSVTKFQPHHTSYIYASRSGTRIDICASNICVSLSKIIDTFITYASFVHHGSG